MKGRAPVPTKIKKLRGNPSKCALNEDVDDKYPKLTSIGEPPDVMTGNDLAIAEWYRLGDRLVEMELLKETDMAAFTLYCMAFSRFIQAEEEINLTGLTISVTTASGVVVKKNPAIQASETYQSSMLRILVQLGFTPASRTKIILPEDKDDDFVSKILSTAKVSKYKKGAKGGKKKAKK